MNDFYVSKWGRVRHIEGASQRVQEDTMRFAGIVEGLGVAIVDSIMTLFAFLPVLMALSSNVTSLPFVGEIANPSDCGHLLVGVRYCVSGHCGHQTAWTGI